MVNKDILTESLDNAWMIRNDGVAFRMSQHVYGNYEEIEETLYAAEWLYNHTQHDTTKQLIINLIASWGAQLGTGNIIQDILDTIQARPYKFLSYSFIESVEEELKDSVIYEDIQSLNHLVVDELNQEFLRARYGGMYNSTPGNREMIFRVSSVEFNWFNIIYDFVYDRKSRIDSVTIVQDEESTGFNNYYTHGTLVFNALPTTEFITIHGSPIVEDVTIDAVQRRLAGGDNIQNSMNTRMNFGRLADKWQMMKHNFFAREAEM